MEAVAEAAAGAGKMDLLTIAADGGIRLGEFASFNLAIVVYLLGVRLNNRLPVLQAYNIPEPVSGGILVALVSFACFQWFQIEFEFSLGVRDFLLLYFFTAIGLNARLSDLIKGGKPLAILLVLTVLYMLAQNLVAVGVAVLADRSVAFGLLGGTISLIGGHGTAAAWAPIMSDAHNVVGANELGASSATLGLIAAALLGGPIADFLIRRRGAQPGLSADADAPIIGIEHDEAAYSSVTHVGLMRSLLVLNLTIAIGYGLHGGVLLSLGFDLPLFLVCLLCGIILSNLKAFVLPKLPWPARSRSLALVSDLALGIFLTLSLMSLKLWTIGELAGVMMVILALQVLMTTIFVVWVLFPLMGRDYDAAVLGAGFAGFGLGATPTAIANMTAVTKQYGASTKALLVLPLVSAFFVDLLNAGIISLFLKL